MKKYFAIMKCSFFESIAYRKSFLTSILANAMQIVVSFFVWKSIFSYQIIINGYTWETMKQYIFVSFLCNGILSFGFEMQAAYNIINGDIIMDLLKPISYRALVFWKAIGAAGFEFIVTSLITCLLYFWGDGHYEFGIVRGISFFISLLLGQTLKFSIQYLFSLICFYTDNAYGVLKGREIFTNFFSGALIPLAMFPEQIREVVNVLPFSGIVYIPCGIFIGTFSMREVASAIIFQIFWCVILFIMGSVFWKKASSVLTVYGG